MLKNKINEARVKSELESHVALNTLGDISANVGALTRHV